MSGVPMARSTTQEACASAMLALSGDHPSAPEAAPAEATAAGTPPMGEPEGAAAPPTSTEEAPRAAVEVTG